MNAETYEQIPLNREQVGCNEICENKCNNQIFQGSPFSVEPPILWNLWSQRLNRASEVIR